MHHSPSSAENYSAPSHTSSSSAHTIAFRIFLLATILTPIAFLPTSYIALDLIKVIVIALGTLASALFLAIAARKEKKLILPPRHISWAAGILAVAISASALLSSHSAKSFFGQGFEYATASFILILLLASFVSYSLIRQSFHRVVVLYVGMVCTYVALIVFQLIRLMMNPEFLQLAFLGNGTSTILGSWHSLATYSLVVALIGITALIFLPLSGRTKILYGMLTIFSFFGACMAYNKNVWQAFAIVLLVLIVHGYVNGFKKSHDVPGSFKHRISWLCIIAFIVAAGLFWKGNTIVTPLVTYLHAEYSEVSLSWRSTLDIAAAVVKENPVLGIGPNRFAQAYIAHKPIDINLTSAWSAEFTSGSGVIPTFIVTQGLLGAALWLVCMILYLMIAVRTLRHLPADPRQRFVLVSSFATSFFLWIMLLTSIPSHTLIFFTFVLTGAAIGAAVFCGIIKPTEIILERSQQGIRRYFFLIPVVFIVGAVAWGLIYIKKVVALSFFGSGIQALTVNQDADAAHVAFRKALKIDSSDIYWRAEVEALLSKAAMVVRETSEKKLASVPQETVLMVTNAIKDALEASHAAIAYDPANYYNYVSEARVFETAASLKIDRAVDNAIQSYMRAITLNPRNPGLYLTLARFQASQNKLDDALQTVGAAIKVRPNYLEAIFLVSQIQASKGNLPDALVAARVASEIDPTSPLLLFQLGFLYYTDKQYGLAAQSLEKAIQLQSDYANAQYFLGLAYAYQGRRADAIVQFETLKRSNPTNIEVALILSNLKAGKNPFANAEPPVTSAPEKRNSLPLKEDSSD